MLRRRRDAHLLGLGFKVLKQSAGALLKKSMRWETIERATQARQFLAQLERNTVFEDIERKGEILPARNRILDALIRGQAIFHHRIAKHWLKQTWRGMTGVIVCQAVNDRSQMLHGCANVGVACVSSRKAISQLLRGPVLLRLGPRDTRPNPVRSEGCRVAGLHCGTVS